MDSLTGFTWLESVVVRSQVYGATIHHLVTAPSYTTAIPGVVWDNPVATSETSVASGSTHIAPGM